MDQRELYQQVILEHNRYPRNFGSLENPTHELKGNNPLCGDHLKLSLIFSNENLEEIAFDGEGCAISKASASLMTDFVKGKSKEEIKTIFEIFRNMIMGKTLSPDEEKKIGKLKIFSGIYEYPSRVKCAILAWHTLVSVLEGETQPIETENKY